MQRGHCHQSLLTVWHSLSRADTEDELDLRAVEGLGQRLQVWLHIKGGQHFTDFLFDRIVEISKIKKKKFIYNIFWLPYTNILERSTLIIVIDNYNHVLFPLTEKVIIIFFTNYSAADELYYINFWTGTL